MSNTPNDQLPPEEYSRRNPMGAGGSTSTDTGLPPKYVPPPRFRTTPDISPMAVAQGGPQRSMVSVPGVVSSQNVVQQYYQPSRESRTILAKMDDPTRLRLQQQMYAAGWYGSRTPQFMSAAKKGVGYIGLSDADEAAFAELLFTANVQGVTWDVVLNTMSKAPKVALGAGGRSRPSSETLTEILQRASLETIGRRLDDETVGQLVGAYQTAYVGAGVEQPASADVFFKNRIESKYGAETEATKYLTAISTIAKLLGG